MLWTAGLLSYGCSTAFAEPPLLPIRAVTLSPTVTEHMVPVVTAMAIDPTGGWIAVAGDDNAVRISVDPRFFSKSDLTWSSRPSSQHALPHRRACAGHRRQ